MKRASTFFIVPLTLCSVAGATPLIINATQTVRLAVRVNVIRVADDAGGQAAPTFGTATQQASILAGVDTVWSQAGIDLQFKFRPTIYNNSFALGTPGSTTVRSTSDLNQIVNTASAAGILDSDPTVLNLFQVRVVPGFNQRSDNTSNGLAFVNGNGIGFWTGPNLPTFDEGTVLVAKVLAHEIGHNLGLPHIVDTQNLMQASSSDFHEARLTADQVSTARSSQFTTVLGDANGDDTVNFDDLIPLAQNYNLATGRTRATGDFNFDGAANFDDLILLAQNYNYTFSSVRAPDFASPEFDADWALAQSLVPEPTTFAAVIAVALPLTRRRRAVSL